MGAASAEERPALLRRAKELAEQVKAAEAAQADAEAAFTAAHMAISNVVIDGVPAGGEDDYRVLDVVGEPPAIENPKDHLELGESLGLIDMQRGAKVSGSRFYFLTGRGALLQLGLLQLALRLAVDNGFIPMIPPVLVRPEVMAGTGFLGAHADEVYRVEADDLYLVGTSEVPLAGYHADEILDLSGGPLRYAGWSSCFRREAGSYGKDTRGIIRVHQFDKVEGFVYCTPADAEAEHQRLLGWQREMLALIEVPYRVIDVAAGDLGSSAARKFDCEAWVPTQRTYRELTSTSNCTTFQARRLATRYRDDNGQAADRGHAQRHAGHHPVAGRDPGEPPAARRQRAGARRAGAVRGHRAARALSDAREGGAARLQRDARGARGEADRVIPPAQHGEVENLAIVELGAQRRPQGVVDVSVVAQRVDGANQQAIPLVGPARVVGAAVRQ